MRKVRVRVVEPSATLYMSPLGVVLRHALALHVHNGEVGPSLGVALIGRLAKPGHRLSLVLRHAMALDVHNGEVGPSLGVALIGRLAKPGHRLSLVLRHAMALDVHGGEVGLSLGVALVSRSLNSLAVPYQAQRHYAEAQSLYKRSLTIYEKAPGPALMKSRGLFHDGRQVHVDDARFHRDASILADLVESRGGGLN
jgi:hypothetical protein